MPSLLLGTMTVTDVPHKVTHTASNPWPSLVPAENAVMSDKDLPQLAWLKIFACLDDSNQLTCTLVSKLWRACTLPRMSQMSRSYQILERMHSPTLYPLLRWQVTKSVETTPLFEKTRATISSVLSSSAPISPASKLQVILFPLHSGPFTPHPSRAIDHIHLAFSGVIHNATAHRPIETLVLSAHVATMPTLLLRIPASISCCIRTLCVKSHGCTGTIEVDPCFLGCSLPDLRSLSICGSKYDVHDIRTACPQLSHLRAVCETCVVGLQHLGTLPHLVDLEIKDLRAWEVLAGLTKLTRLIIGFSNTPLALDSARHILESMTQLQELELTQPCWPVIVPADLPSTQQAFDSIYQALPKLRLLSLQIPFPIIISHPSASASASAFASVQCVKITDYMHITGPAAACVRSMIVSTSGTQSAVSPFPAGIIYLQAPLNTLLSATACSAITHLAVTPVVCSKDTISLITDAVVANPWPLLTELVLLGDMLPDADFTIEESRVAFMAAEYTHNSSLLRALASIPGGTLGLQRVTLHSLLNKPYSSTVVVDQIVEALCRLEALTSVVIQGFDITPAHLLQLASKPNMLGIELIYYNIPIGWEERQATQQLVGTRVTITWRPAQYPREIDTSWWRMEHGGHIAPGLM